MVQETLSVDEVEWEIMECPNTHKEARVTEHAIAYWVLDWIQSTTSCERISTHDASKHAERHDANPPIDDVANQVNLSLEIVVGPKADAAQQEWPVERSRCVWVIGCQSGIVLKHQDLKLGELLEEIDVLDGLVFDVHRAISEIVTGSILQDLIDIPNIRLVQVVLVAIYFLLTKRPVRKLAFVGPQGDSSRHMDQSEMSTLASERFALVRFLHLDLEHGIIATILGIGWDRGKLLIRWHKRRGDVVRKQQRLCHDVLQLNDVILPDDTSTSRRRNLLGRQDLPVIVRIVVRVTRNLLTLTTDSTIIISEGVPFHVRMQKRFRILVLESDRVKVSNLLSVQQEFIALQGLLKSRAHERVSGTRVDQDSQVNPKEEHVEH